MRKCEICNRNFEKVYLWVLNPNRISCLECLCGLYAQLYEANNKDVESLIESLISTSEKKHTIELNKKNKKIKELRKENLDFSSYLMEQDLLGDFWDWAEDND